MSKTKTIWKNNDDEWEDINLGDVFLVYVVQTNMDQDNKLP